VKITYVDGRMSQTHFEIEWVSKPYPSKVREIERVRWLRFCKVAEMIVLAGLGYLALYGPALGPTNLAQPL